MLTNDTSAMAGFPRTSDVPVKSRMSSMIYGRGVEVSAESRKGRQG